MSSLRVDAVHSPADPVPERSRGPDRGHCAGGRFRKASEGRQEGYREEEILEAVRTLVENGLTQIKCYFMIGLPSETDEDVKAIPPPGQTDSPSDSFNRRRARIGNGGLS